MTIVISIGGSMINPEGKPDSVFLKNIAKIIKSSKERFGLVTGGGSSARAYANAARELGASEYEADEVAVISTRQNAQILILALEKEGIEVEKKAISDFTEAKCSKAQVVVMCGTIPGITTDTDSVLLAEAIGAKKVINLSNVDAIYDSDPRKNPKAKKFDSLSYDELISLAATNDKRAAGTNFVFDMLACKLIARSKIETHFVSGKDLNQIKAAIDGKKHSGTVVRG
jgi:uridylate kinase